MGRMQVSSSLVVPGTSPRVDAAHAEPTSGKPAVIGERMGIVLSSQPGLSQPALSCCPHPATRIRAKRRKEGPCAFINEEAPKMSLPQSERIEAEDVLGQPQPGLTGQSGVRLNRVSEPGKHPTCSNEWSSISKGNPFVPLPTHYANRKKFPTIVDG